MPIIIRGAREVIEMREVRCASTTCMARNDAPHWAWMPLYQDGPWFCSKECEAAYMEEQLIELMAHQEGGACDCPDCQAKGKEKRHENLQTQQE